MRRFLVVWLGQAISLLGSGLTAFALGVWVLKETGSVTRYALISLSTVLPGIAIAPWAGALVDRWDRRATIMVSDLASALTTLLIAGLIAADRLELWHLYLLLAIASVAAGFQAPAFTAATTMIVAKRHLGRAAGLTQLGQAGAQVAAPLLAGVALGLIRLPGILVADFLTFLLAVSCLTLIRIPSPRTAADPRAAPEGLNRQVADGWRFLRDHPGLLGLLVLFAYGNFTLGLVQVLITPLVLSFAPVSLLGVVLSVASSGLLVGGVAMSLWGGPRRRVRTILWITGSQGWLLLLAGLRPDPVLIAATAFLFLLGVPVVMGSAQALWQSKVPPPLQGRVFALRRMVAMSTLPLAYLAAGLLSDGLFEPLLADGGALASSVGQLIGVGPGRGIALLFMILGGALVWLAFLASRFRPLREVEWKVPDAIPDTSPDDPEKVTSAAR